MKMFQLDHSRAKIIRNNLETLFYTYAFHITRFRVKENITWSLPRTLVAESFRAVGVELIFQARDFMKVQSTMIPAIVVGKQTTESSKSSKRNGLLRSLSVRRQNEATSSMRKAQIQVFPSPDSPSSLVKVLPPRVRLREVSLMECSCSYRREVLF